MDSERQFYIPPSGSLSSAASAGRFRLPLSFLDRLTLELQKKAAEMSGASDSYILQDHDYPIPPQWQLILDYLYELGVITSPRVYFEEFFNDEPKLFSLRLFSVFGREPTDGRTSITSGHSRGVSLDFEEALSKVTGEFLERYPLTVYRRKDFLRAHQNYLKRAGKLFLDVNDLAGFADWQKDLFPARKFSDESIFFWTEGREILSGKKSLIPAQLVFWNYDVSQEPAEPFLRQPITNGAAGHFTLEEAILAGIYENIQRDAFLIWWLNSTAPPRIDLETIEDKELKRVIASALRYRFEVILLNTTLDLAVPSCACVLVDTTGVGPRVALGGGCGPDFASALLRSITEAISVYHWLRANNRSFVIDENYKPFKNSEIGQEERLLLWADERMFSRFQTFISGPGQSFREAARSFPSAFPSASEELKYVKDIFRMRGKGYEIYVYQARHEVLDALGYHSVRVVIPALVPLYLHENYAPLGARRLFEVPAKMGFRAADEPNPWPHPFP